MIRKKVKPKYDLGGFLGTNAGPLTMGADLIASTGGAGRVIGGVGKGVLAGASLGLPGMIAGGALGLVTSLLGNKKQKEEEQKLKEQDTIAGQANERAISQQALAGYNTAGNTTEYYADGGSPEHDYEVEKGEVVQGNPDLEESTKLASDMHLVGGRKHSQGGTEGSGGERIYSDRLKVGKEATKALETLGIKLPNSATFADAAKYLGRNKGKAEKKIASRIAPSVRTGKRMMQDQDDALDTIFQIQEMMKPMNNNSKPKYANGGVPTLKPINSGIKLDGITPQASIVNPNLTISNNIPTAKPSFFDLLKQNQGQIMNAANYAANLNSISKLDTTVKRNYLPTPRYNYTDRSGLAKSNNMATYRTAVKGLTSSSQGVNASNAGALYAQTLENNNIINNQENQRFDQYNDNYNQRADRVNFANTSIMNDANDDSRDLQNNKRVAMPLQARNAFLQGYAGNTAMTQKNNLDKQRMILSAYLNNEEGTMDRFTKGFEKFKQSSIYKTLSDGRI